MLKWKGYLHLLSLVVVRCLLSIIPAYYCSTNLLYSLNVIIILHRLLWKSKVDDDNSRSSSTKQHVKLFTFLKHTLHPNIQWNTLLTLNSLLPLTCDWIIIINAIKTNRFDFEMNQNRVSFFFLLLSIVKILAGCFFLLLANNFGFYWYWKENNFNRIGTFKLTHIVCE